MRASAVLRAVRRAATLGSTNGGSVGERISVPATAAGYIFRTDCDSDGWSYIGQSTRTDHDNVASYFGSGEGIRMHVAEHGTAGLQKTVLAIAETQLELHYLEMLHLAAARRDGLMVRNGDFGGPRPFSVMQRALYNLLPEAYAAAISNPKKFHRIIARNRDLVEVAILDVTAAPTEDYYAGLERDLLTSEDLTNPCPTCGAAAGAVCRTNANSLTKPRNPSRNHARRPRRTS